MSKRQGDGYRTETNEGLNRYYNEVFLPKLLEMAEQKIKEYRINGGKIICEQQNIVESDGWKLKSLRVTGKQFWVRVYSDETSKLADVVESFYDRDEANNRFKFWKAQLMV